SDAAKAAMRNAVNVALNRPSRAGNEVENHPARFANDGDRNTAWVSRERLGWWMVDLEGAYQLASLRLTFAGEGNFRFVVDVSVDSHSWRTAVDRSATDDIRAQRNDVFPPGTIGRYMRVRFVHVPPDLLANLAEVGIYGILSVR